MIATVYLFVIIPKGFFPQQDTGILFGTTEAGQDVSFAEMYKLQQRAGAIVMADPAVETMAMGLGTGTGNAAQNNGRMFITLKPLEDRDVDVFQVIARLRPKLAQIPGMKVYLQAAQDVTVGGRFSRTQFQYTLQDANYDELSAWSAKILDKLKSLPELRDVATDQQNGGTTLTLKIDRDMASRYGIQPQLIDDTLYDAFGQREVTQYFTQVNTYYVVEEVLPNLLGDPATLDKLYIRSPTSNQMIPMSAFAKWTTAPIAALSISHQGQFPATTISFNLAMGEALGTATAAIQRAMQQLQLPPGLTTTFQGNAQAFQDSLTTVPLLILAALVCVYLILGVLYESFIHPLTILSTLPSAGLGALATLMLFGYEFSLVALIGTILLIGIVKKNGIMMVDFAISAAREEGLTAGRGDPQGGAIAFPSDHDDDHGGAARRRAADAEPWHRLGAAPAARLYDGRRPHCQPGADAVHHARHLPLSRRAVALALRVRQSQAVRAEAEARAGLGPRAGPSGGVRRSAGASAIHEARTAFRVRRQLELATMTRGSSGRSREKGAARNSGGSIAMPLRHCSEMRRLDGTLHPTLGPDAGATGDSPPDPRREAPLADHRQGRAPPPRGQTQAAEAHKHHHPGRRFRDARYGAEQTCILIVDAVGEVEGVRASVLASAPESEGPKAARRVMGARIDVDRAFERVGHGVERVDLTVEEAEIADQKVAAELAESWTAPG